MAGGPKKWFMLQVWRIQQVSQVVTIAMLSYTVANLIFLSIQWRLADTYLEDKSYLVISMFIGFLLLVIWFVAIWWDMRMKMWREQATVLIERNPYAKEKLSAKEVAQYELLWLPLLDRLAKDEPNIKESIESLRAWIHKSYTYDPMLASDVKEIFEHIDGYRKEKAMAGKK
ncbi:MAG TPA: hypothetical protein VGB78_02315 [Thermoplasmata archaeon]